ncbi:MAG: ABC-2 family transporter protein [Acidimicrobiia bacterium]|nr:ABC-2 family transporter protein [Acidimicrobiia bacterium]
MISIKGNKNRFSLYYLIVILSAKDKNSNFAGWVVNGTQIALRITIYAGMYRLALGSSDSRFVNGIWAIAISQLIFGCERPQLSIQIGREIKDGTVSMYLLRPVNYINQMVFSYFGRSIPGLSSIAVFGFATAYLITGKIPINILNLPFVICVIFLGIALAILIETFLGMTGFWTNDTNGVQLMNHKLNLLFGGIIIPFALLPTGIAKIVRFTPWSMSLAQPGYVATHFSYTLFIEISLLIILWCFVTYLLCLYLFYKGIRKLNLGGG